MYCVTPGYVCDFLVLEAAELLAGPQEGCELVPVPVQEAGEQQLLLLIVFLSGQLFERDRDELPPFSHQRRVVLELGLFLEQLEQPIFVLVEVVFLQADDLRDCRVPFFRCADCLLFSRPSD